MHKLLLLSVESIENPHSGAMNSVQMKKPFAPKEKTPPFGIPINARQLVITLDAPSLLIK
jgi:hypothetical protein